MTALSFVWVYPYSQNSRCDTYFYNFSILHVTEEREAYINFILVVSSQ